MARRVSSPITDEQLATVARALANPARVRILRLLAAQDQCRGSEVFAQLPLAQSTISEHLRVLKQAGLVSSHPVGTGMVYCLQRGPADELLRAVGEIVEKVPECDTPAEGRHP
ncbi:MAG: metalloregulator ArsR/SmtB family transcription factor [Anaerosomatales bacterium]|nr:metalloregulator ArsR/SmtB family transcription factor [Anaerosomatales bacterium]